MHSYISAYRSIQCVVYDDFRSEQQNFQPLGEKGGETNVLQLLPVNATSAFSLRFKSDFTGIRFRYTVDFFGWGGGFCAQLIREDQWECL